MNLDDGKRTKRKEIMIVPLQDTAVVVIDQIHHVLHVLDQDQGPGIEDHYQSRGIEGHGHGHGHVVETENIAEKLVHIQEIVHVYVTKTNAQTKRSLHKKRKITIQNNAKKRENALKVH